MKSWQLVVWAHGPLQWCHQPFKWHTPGRLRHREGGLELGWAHERERERKMENSTGGPVQSPWEGVVAVGSSGSWSRQPCWRAKLNNHSFLTSAEAAPSGEVLGIGYSICPSRVWLNWRCMELLFFFFWWKSTAALLFYHLTLLVGSWGNKRPP